MRDVVNIFFKSLGDSLGMTLYEAPIIQKLDRKKGFLSYNVLRKEYAKLHSRLTRFSQKENVPVETIYVPVQASISITSVAESRDLSESLSKKLNFYLGSVRGKEIAEALGVGVTFVGTVTRRTPQEGNFFEYQYGFDLNVNYQERAEYEGSTETVNTIHHNQRE